MVCRILVADDSSTIQKVIRIGLAAIQADIKSAGSLVEATKSVDQGPLDLIIADAGLPGISTAGDFIKLVERAGNVPLIILMGSYEAVRESDLRAVGITHIIKKPFPPNELPLLVQELTGSGKTPPVPKGPSAPMSGIPSFPEAASLPLTPPSFSLSDEGPSATDATTSRQSTPQGGLPSFLLEDDHSLGGVPPFPEVEPARKGRPAFESRQPEPSPPRASFTQHVESSGSGGSQPSSDFFGGKSFGASPGSTSSPSFPQPHTNAGLSAAVEAFVRDELPALVDRAVERYCVEHFKGVAREVLTAELRRLAEEKARYLVDQ
jgi:CheY-like chemotaxis protein